MPLKNNEDKQVNIFSNFSLGLADYWEISGIVINDAPLHIGSGRAVSPAQAIDNPVIKLPDGTPFIPGSSLKGVLRSIVEAYLMNIAKIKPDTACGRLFKDNNVSPEQFMRECSPFPVRGEPSSGEESVKPYCVNIGLFGGPELASHIHVYDMHPRGEVRTFVKPGVAIDRFMGASRPGALYNIELVPPNIEWSLRIRIYGLGLDNNDDAWLCLRETLAFLLEYLCRGISIGSRTSTGLGMIRIKEAKVKHVHIDPSTGTFIEKEHSLEDFIKLLKRVK